MSVLLDKVKRLCSIKGVSIAQLEKELGFSNKTLFAWKDTNLGIDKVEKVAKYFGVSIDYLVSNEDEEESEIDRAKQRLFDENPGFRILFDATEGCPEEELYRAAAIVRALKEQSNRH